MWVAVRLSECECAKKAQKLDCGICGGLYFAGCCTTPVEVTLTHTHSEVTLTHTTTPVEVTLTHTHSDTPVECWGGFICKIN